MKEHLEEPVVKPELKPEPKPEPVSDIKQDKPEPALKKVASEDVQKSTSPAPVDVGPTQKESKVWAEA